MKGRANYLCVHKLDQLTDGAGPAAHDVFLPIIREWSTRPTRAIARSSGSARGSRVLARGLGHRRTCLGTECPRYDDCFVTRMRQRAAASDVVIVNHHLLCADAAVRQNAFGEVIPAFSRAILDEAHQLEDIATQYFGFNVSTTASRSWRETSSGWSRPAGSRIARAKDEIAKAVERLRDTRRRSSPSSRSRTAATARRRRGARARDRRSRSARPTTRPPTSRRARHRRIDARRC
jgi:Rad3-related DNA helicase